MDNALQALAERWREESALFKRYGLDSHARIFELHAVEVERVAREADEELLTMGEAAVESGYSKRRLRQLIVDGSIENVGRKGRPRLRRGDLPRKPRSKSVEPYDPEADAREILAKLQR